MAILTTASGRKRRLPADLDPARVVGLDQDGRIVVDDFDAFNAQPQTVGGYTMQPFLFGLTLCCNASDKGCEDGVYCRACYGSKRNADEGNYLYRAADGTFPDLDPKVTTP
jgi:hypothetical protein